MILNHRNCILATESASALIPAAARHEDFWAAPSWLSLSAPLAERAAPCPSPASWTEGREPSHIQDTQMVFFTFNSLCFCSLLMCFHGHVCHLFIRVCKTNFPCFLLPFYFLWLFYMVVSVECCILITCLTCKLRTRQT